MKANEVRGIVKLALDRRCKKIGYIDFHDFTVQTETQEEELGEVVALLKDVMEPYINEVRP